MPRLFFPNVVSRGKPAPKVSEVRGVSELRGAQQRCHSEFLPS